MKGSELKSGDLVRFTRSVYNLGIGVVIETPHPAASAVKVHFPSGKDKSFHKSLIEVIS